MRNGGSGSTWPRAARRRASLDGDAAQFLSSELGSFLYCNYSTVSAGVLYGCDPNITTISTTVPAAPLILQHNEVLSDAVGTVAAAGTEMALCFVTSEYAATFACC